MWMFIVTVLIGLFTQAFVGKLLDWPDAGAVFAIAFVGVVLNSKLKNIYGNKDEEKAEEKTEEDS